MLVIDSIGIGAPALIVGARLLQGLSVGGEFGSATALLAEQDPNRRGFYSSWQFASQALTGVMATAIGAALLGIQGTEKFDEWGWRLPFLFGLLIGPVAYYIRVKVGESTEFSAVKPHRAPLGDFVKQAKARFLVATGSIVVATAAIYTLIFMPTFAVRELGLPLTGGLAATLASSAVQVLVIPISGALSDQWGRVSITVPAAMMMAFVAVPLFAALLSAPSLVTLFTFQITIGLMLAIYLGPLPALLSELFPTQIRTTGLALSYALAVTIFGGFAPFINASLISLTGSKLVPCLYLVACAMISLTALVVARRMPSISQWAAATSQ